MQRFVPDLSPTPVGATNRNPVEMAVGWLSGLKQRFAKPWGSKVPQRFESSAHRHFRGTKPPQPNF